MDEVISKLGRLIETYRKEHGNMSVREFARRTSLSHSYVHSLQTGRRPQSNKPIDVSLSTVEKLAKAMGKSNAELLEEIGYFDRQQLKKTVWRLSEIADLLPPNIQNKIVDAKTKFLGFEKPISKEEIDVEWLANAIQEML